MATKKAAATSEEKKPGTSLTKWDEELARQADVAAGVEASTSTGQFFGLKGGILTFDGNPVPGNQMAVIILDAVLETVYYEGEYDADTPQSPVAFAFGRDEKTMTWHENSRPDFAGQLCHEHEVCQWGSADKGKGKAARETRRLAMIPAGTIDKNNGNFKAFKDEEHFEKAAIGYMKLPVTSVKGYSAFAKNVIGALRRPQHAVFTRVTVKPHPKNQFEVVFEPLDKVPDNLLDVVMRRHGEAQTSIETPYSMAGDEADEKPAKRGAKAAKPAAKKTARKY